MYLIIPTTRLLFEVTQWSMYTNNQYTVLAITIVGYWMDLLLSGLYPDILSIQRSGQSEVLALLKIA